METKKKVEFIDYIILFIRKKRFFISVFLITGIIAYLLIYFFVKEEFEARATILPVSSSEAPAISGILKNIKSLPVSGLGGETNQDMNLYTSIVYSRTFIEDIINKFNLYKQLDIDTNRLGYRELTLNMVRKLILTKISDDQVYEITVTLNNPVLVAKVTNYIIDLLNRTIVDLQITKSKNNREFLDQRYKDVQNRLSLAEESLRKFQEKSGLLDSKEQIKGIMSAYSDLESKYITQQVELSVLEKISNENSPQVKNLKTQVDELGKKMSDLQIEGNKDGYLLALKSLPKKATEYVSLYREVEINSSILEFLVPLYEQAKFQEQKDTPVLQVIDRAVVPEKKSYPPRTIFALIIAMAAVIFSYILIVIKENENWQNSEKIKWVKQNLFKWRTI